MAHNEHQGSVGVLVRELASLWGVQLAYRDSNGRRRESPRDAVMQVLGALSAGTQTGPWPGAGTGRGDERENVLWLREAVLERKTRLGNRIVPPVLVAWDGLLPDTSVDGKNARVKIQLEVEGEDEGEPRWTGGPCAWGCSTGLGGSESRLPFGYHRLVAEVGDQAQEALVISAPRQCWTVKCAGVRWGVFAPTYALRSDRDWGAGDLNELGVLLESVARHGGEGVSTLPLLASYLDTPFEQSPYAPVSRIFWNESYLAVEQTEEWALCRPARAAWESEWASGAMEERRSSSLVDHAAVAALKKHVLAELSGYYFREAGADRRLALEDYVRRRPDVLAYAEFRSRVETEGADWRSWRATQTDRVEPVTNLRQLSESGRLHVYAQWQMDEQLMRLSGRGSGGRSCEDSAAGLFLDVPVGVHPGGFDTWRWRGLFAEGVSVGAPPDSFFATGQCWGSPPLDPERCREAGHSYWRRVLGHHMRPAKLLRIDHVMSLHRLFWIPEGRDPSEGVYVTYPAEELYAALCLESHRQRTEVVGEDLGTVPAGVRADMRRHGLLSTWVLQGSLRPRSAQVIEPGPRRALAALGTHDMYPFAGFVCGDDILARLQRGESDSATAEAAMAARQKLVARLSSFLLGKEEWALAELLSACLAYLSKNGSRFVLVNLDDLLLQREPQNIPGTGSEQGNWRRRLSCGTQEVERAITMASRWLHGGS